MAQRVGTTFAAVDVGTNAVRLKLVRARRDGSLEVLHEERDPIRPGEGVFETGSIPPPVAARLIETLRGYNGICRRHHAEVRAVATSAIREARNGPEIVKRASREAGIDLEVISGREEARLICLGVLGGTPARTRSLVVDIGGGSTEVAVADGEQPRNLYSLALGAVRLTEIFGSSGKVAPRKLGIMRGYAAEIVERSLPARITGAPRTAIGSSGTIRAVVTHAAAAGTAHASAEQIARAAGELALMSPLSRRQLFDPARAEIVVAGAVVLEAVARRLKLASIAATDRGLRDGLLLDLQRRHEPRANEVRLADAAVAAGRGLGFDEPHAWQVAGTSLALFDALAQAHDLPARARGWLQVAALLHDVGHAIGYQRHHKHAAYLIQNADIPGLTEHERDLVARVARYHRRSPPELTHAGMAGLSDAEARLVRKLATILRVADSLDRSHHQPVTRLAARLRNGQCVVRLEPSAPLDLELWDVEHELGLFRRVFRRRLVVDVKTTAKT